MHLPPQIVIISLLVVLGFVFLMVLVGGRAPVVSVTDEGLSVKSAMYSAQIAFGDMSELTLVHSLPRILLKTNGFAAGGKLRGSFKVAELGSGKLFVDLRRPPFILVKTPTSFLAVNLEGSRETEALYRSLARWSGQTG